MLGFFVSMLIAGGMSANDALAGTSPFESIAMMAQFEIDSFDVITSELSTPFDCTESFAERSCAMTEVVHEQISHYILAENKKQDPEAPIMLPSIDETLPYGPPPPPIDHAAQAKMLGIAPPCEIPEEKAKWSWQVQAGGNFRQGSTNNTNIRGAFSAQRHSIRSDNSGKIEGTYVEDGSVGTQNRRAFGDFTHDRNAKGNWIGFFREEVEYDEAKFINLRALSSIGLGYKLIDQLKKRWVLRSGPSITYVDYDQPSPLDDGFRFGWLAESDYRQVFWEQSRFEWKMTTFYDFDDRPRFRFRNEAALLFPIGGCVSPWNWKLGARHEYVSESTGTTNKGDFEGYFAIQYTK